MKNQVAHVFGIVVWIKTIPVSVALEPLMKFSRGTVQALHKSCKFLMNAKIAKTRNINNHFVEQTAV